MTKQEITFSDPTRKVQKRVSVIGKFHTNTYLIPMQLTRSTKKHALPSWCFYVVQYSYIKPVVQYLHGFFYVVQ